MRPLLWPKDKIRVIFDSRYGIRFCFLFIASTHCASTKRDLLIAELSTRRSLLLSVRRLSSDPARSIHEARLTRTVVSVVCVILTQRMAWDREECALSFASISRVLRGGTLVLPSSLTWIYSCLLGHKAVQIPSESCMASRLSQQLQSCHGCRG